MSAPLVSVVVLNWLDPNLASRSLASAASELRGLPFELVIVENGSVHPVDPASVGHPLETITLARNVGVSRGRNAGIRAARGTYVLILDDDAVCVRGMAHMIAFLEQNDDVGMAGPRIVDSSGGLMFTCRRFPTLLDKVARRLPAAWGTRVLNESELRDWDHAEPAFVDYVIGACQLIRAEALAEIGPYEGRMFYGPEDVDLCLRMWQSGWQVAYFPGATVVHDERRLTRHPSILALRHMSALGRFFVTHRYFLSRKSLYRRLPRPGLVGSVLEPGRPIERVDT